MKNRAHFVRRGKRRKSTPIFGEIATEQRTEALSADVAESRTGVFSFGIVAIDRRAKIAQSLPDMGHAVRNPAAVLDRRAKGLRIPVQMYDAGSSNAAGAFETPPFEYDVHDHRTSLDRAAFPPRRCAS